MGLTLQIPRNWVNRTVFNGDFLPIGSGPNGGGAQRRRSFIAANTVSVSATMLGSLVAGLSVEKYWIRDSVARSGYGSDIIREEGLSLRTWRPRVIGTEQKVSPQSLGERLRRSVKELSAGLFEDEAPCSLDAVESFVRLMEAALTCPQIGSDPPPLQLTTLGDGDLECEWPWGDKGVSLSFSPDGMATLRRYVRRSSLPYVDERVKNPSAHAVASALSWLATINQPCP